jgi:hypothetical protein
MLTYYPELQGGVIVQSNFASLNSGRVAAELADIFFGDRMQPATATVASGPPAPDANANNWKPTAAELAAYAGRFYSSEVEAVYQLVVKGDSLMLSHHRMGDRRLQPRARDTFAAGAGIGEIRFDRNASGQITGFTIANGRTRGVRFEPMR